MIPKQFYTHLHLTQFLLMPLIMISFLSLIFLCAAPSQSSNSQFPSFRFSFIDFIIPVFVYVTVLFGLLQLFVVVFFVYHSSLWIAKSTLISVLIIPLSPLFILAYWVSKSYSCSFCSSYFWTPPLSSLMSILQRQLGLLLFYSFESLSHQR